MSNIMSIQLTTLINEYYYYYYYYYIVYNLLLIENRTTAIISVVAMSQPSHAAMTLRHDVTTGDDCAMTSYNDVTSCCHGIKLSAASAGCDISNSPCSPFDCHAVGSPSAGERLFVF